MPITEIVTGAIIDIAKKELFKEGKNIAHEFIDSASGKNLGQIICYRNEEKYNSILLFVHGFSGSAAETFGCTPELLINQSSMNGWDIFSIGYSSDIFPSIGKGLWSVNPDIAKIGKYLNTILANQFGNYKRIAFVAHSMGGLAVQRAILDASNSVKQKISHVLFFGTPSAGLKKAYWFRFWNTQVHDLSSESEFIKNLRRDWSSAFTDPYPFSFKTIAGTKDEFVPVISSLNPFDKKYQGVIEGNHVSMIKPLGINDTQHQSYQIIFRTLMDQQKEFLDGDAEEINLELGEYHAVINKFLPKVMDIDAKSLTQLIFALECSGRKSEVISILRQHPVAVNNSDLLGILGGRYKRQYLLEGLQSELDSAFEYYERAFTIATAAADNKEISYHAINLAFLNIVAKNNDTETKRYSRIALDHCLSDNKDLWELATIAEANMYLGNSELAEHYYRDAAKLAGNDIRAKGSIHSNAYYGYQSLMATKNTNAEFLKMLDELFL